MLNIPISLKRMFYEVDNFSNDLKKDVKYEGFSKGYMINVAGMRVCRGSVFSKVCRLKHNINKEALNVNDKNYYIKGSNN